MRKMTAKQFAELLQQLGFASYDAAARGTAIGRRSIVRYATGEAPVPTMVQRYLLLLAKHGAPQEPKS